MRRIFSTEFDKQGNAKVAMRRKKEKKPQTPCGPSKRDNGVPKNQKIDIAAWASSPKTKKKKLGKKKKKKNGRQSDGKDGVCFAGKGGEKVGLRVFGGSRGKKKRERKRIEKKRFYRSARRRRGRKNKEKALRPGTIHRGGKQGSNYGGHEEKNKS